MSGSANLQPPEKHIRHSEASNAATWSPVELERRCGDAEPAAPGFILRRKSTVVEQVQSSPRLFWIISSMAPGGATTIARSAPI